MKACPFCAEEIQDAAIVCKHCGRAVSGDVAATTRSLQRNWSPGVAAVLSLIIPGAGQLYKGRIMAGLFWLVLTVLGYLMMVLPGILVHVFVIYEAYSGPSNDELERRKAARVEKVS